MKIIPAVCVLLGAATLAGAQSTNSIPLWPNGAPGALGKEDKDVPTLTVYSPAPEKANGAALVICPGGGYGALAPHEGEHYARWLNELGITSFVLKYRLGSGGYRHPAMLNDAARAIRTVRARAEEWKLDPKRIGLMGSSAGGHLTSTLLTHFDKGNSDSSDSIEKASSRPDLGIMCYPVISMGEHAHQGSKKNLLGENPSAELVKELSNELHVTKDTPPCFIWHTWEDKSVKIENALGFISALQAAGVRFEFHVYEKGGHGLGLGTRDWKSEKRHPWTVELARWLKERGFAK